MLEVAPGVYRLGSRHVNFYLIEEGGSLTLLDAGLAGYWHYVPSALNLMGRQLQDIRAVLLTHWHPDHAGLAERIRREAQATVYIHDADADFVSGRRRPPPPRFLLQAWRPFLFGYLRANLRAGAAKLRPVTEVTAVADGDVLDIPGRPRVVHAPGHSPGSCALVLEERSVLFSGDVLATFNAYTGRTGPTVMPGALNDNSSQALDSLRFIEHIDARTLLPAHGEPWSEGVGNAVRVARQSGVP